MIELKPCPFCGRKITKYSIGTINGIVERLDIECCMTFIVKADEMLWHGNEMIMTGQDARQKWNQRVTK